MYKRNAAAAPNGMAVALSFFSCWAKMMYRHKTWRMKVHDICITGLTFATGEAKQGPFIRAVRLLSEL